MQCEIARRFFELLNAITMEQKIPRTYYGGHVLYRSEMELLEKIDAYPSSNLSDLSEKSGVTKSAVTQMSAKLLSKGLIEKYQSPQNKKEKYFRLTPAGQQVRHKYLEANQLAAQELQDYLCALSAKDKKTIIGFMEMLQHTLPICAFPCQHSETNNACFLAAERKKGELTC